MSVAGSIEATRELCSDLDNLIELTKESRAPIRALSFIERARADLQAYLDEIERTSSAPPRLVEIGLKAKTRSAPSDRQRAAIADLASTAIDSLTAGAPNNDEKAGRKRRLIKGPEEFREVRVDRPKGK